MLTGFVKWFDPRRNYGFIRFCDESGSWHEVFFHGSQVDFTPRDGDFVSFLIRDCWKGQQAVNVERKKIIEVYN